MKKFKIVMFTFLIVGSIVAASNRARAFNSEGGGGAEVQCKSPLTNVCYEVYVGGIKIKSEKGVATIKL